MARDDEVTDGLRTHESDYRSAVAAGNVQRSIRLVYGICFAA
jgi:hypothetical protein